MKWFLDRISLERLPVYFGIKDREIHSRDFNKLLAKGVLKRSNNLDEMPCRLCEENAHSCQVRNEEGELFCVCENGNGTFTVTDKELTLFEYDNETFLRIMAKELSISANRSSFKEQSRHSDNSLFFIGTIEANGASIYYLRTDDDFEIPILSEKTRNERKIILFSVQLPDTDENGNTAYCSLLDLLAPKERKALFDPKNLSTVFSDRRRIAFDDKGCLRLDGKTLYTAETKSKEYYFLLFLFEHWEIPCAHSEIYAFIKEKLGKGFFDTPQNFCSKTKSNIKKFCPEIQSIITAPTRGNYIMSDKNLEETREKKKR